MKINIVEKLLKREYVPDTDSITEMEDFINKQIEYARTKYSSLIVRPSTLTEKEKYIVDKCLELIINKNAIIRYYENVIYKQILIDNYEFIKDKGIDTIAKTIFCGEEVVNG